VTAFPLLEQHQATTCCFNDDVQGTAAVVLGGIFSALPLTPTPKVRKQSPLTQKSSYFEYGIEYRRGKGNGAGFQATQSNHTPLSTPITASFITLLTSPPRFLTSQIADHTFLFYGAGAAGVGIADLIALAIQKERPALSLAQAREQIWLVDSRGLVTEDRTYSRDKHKVLPSPALHCIAE
jgi:malic enzyme